MPYKNTMVIIVEKILYYLSLLMLKNRYPYKALLIKPNSNVNEWKTARYKIERGTSGTDYIHFLENGFYYPVPEGNIQYAIIGGKQGAIFGYDGNSLWNIKLSDQEQALKMASETAAEKYITFQIFNEINDRFDSKALLQKYFVYALSIIGVVGILILLLTYVIWEKIGNAQKLTVETIDRLYAVEKMGLVKYAVEHKVSFPEHGIYYDKKNNSIYTIGMPNTTHASSPEIPSLPPLPGIPS